MKYPKLFTLLIFVLSALQSLAQINAGTLIRTREVETSDSIEYYITDYATRQKSYMNLLVGTWNVTIMKKQSRIDPDHLTGVTLILKDDSTFSGNASCNKIWGRFSIKGTSIKFNDISSTKTRCGKQEEENWILELLHNTVSNYSVTRQTLLLRDGSSNIIFEAAKR